jgi:hypothetical protein
MDLGWERKEKINKLNSKDPNNWGNLRKLNWENSFPIYIIL